MIEAILFDLDGTIRLNEPRGSEVFADHAASLGLRVRDDDRLRAFRWEHFYWANSPDLLADRERAGADQGAFWAQYAHRQLVALGASSKQAAEMAPRMNEFMLNSFNPRSIVPGELPAVLRSLREAGIVLGVISNRSQPYRDELTELGLAEFFPYALASGDIQIWKPDPGVFQHACTQLQIPPDRAAYVGDNYFADVVGSRAAGLTPVLYDPRGIFDDPQCAVIASFTELPRALGIRLNSSASV
ncbi:MAG TPA: HAD-IA family hydrolase, partial [Anaerolineales bacterium]|nr:HAD-IA family hydrolase [Anaerolineales bacterium]